MNSCTKKKNPDTNSKKPENNERLLLAGKKGVKKGTRDMSVGTIKRKACATLENSGEAITSKRVRSKPHKLGESPGEDSQKNSRKRRSHRKSASSLPAKTPISEEKPKTNLQIPKIYQRT
jgi:hypothetical protein